MKSKPYILPLQFIAASKKSPVFYKKQGIPSWGKLGDSGFRGPEVSIKL